MLIIQLQEKIKLGYITAFSPFASKICPANGLVKVMIKAYTTKKNAPAVESPKLSAYIDKNPSTLE